MVNLIRPGRDERYMKYARAAAESSTCSRLHVGAAVVSQDIVVGTGYNGAPRGIEHCVHLDDSPCRLAVHAEVNALLVAQVTIGADLYVTHAPCYDCSKLIINARISRVVYEQDYRSRSGIELLTRGNVTVERLRS